MSKSRRSLARDSSATIRGALILGFIIVAILVLLGVIK